MRKVSRRRSKLCEVFIQRQEWQGADKVGNGLCEDMYKMWLWIFLEQDQHLPKIDYWMLDC